MLLCGFCLILFFSFYAHAYHYRKSVSRSQYATPPRPAYDPSTSPWPIKLSRRIPMSCSKNAYCPVLPEVEVPMRPYLRLLSMDERLLGRKKRGCSRFRHRLRPPLEVVDRSHHRRRQCRMEMRMTMILLWVATFPRRGRIVDEVIHLILLEVERYLSVWNAWLPNLPKLERRGGRIHPIGVKVCGTMHAEERCRLRL